MGVIEFNGQHYELDFMDADNIKLYERAMQRFREDTQGILAKKADLTATELFSEMIEGLDRFIATMLGRSAVKNLFGKTKNLRERIKVVSAIVKCACNIAPEIEKLMELFEE